MPDAFGVPHIGDPAGGDPAGGDPADGDPAGGARPSPLLRRRCVIAAAGATAVGGGLVLAGCSSVDLDGAGTGRSGAEGAADEGGAGAPLGSTADVPVGGAMIFAAEGVVVTQASEGSFAGYSTTCPHQGCAVTSVDGAEIVCPCHNSRFALDGSVIGGPATRGLDDVEVSVDGDRILRA